MGCYIKQDVTCTCKYAGDTVTDDMLLDFAKEVWKNNLITSKIIFDEDVMKIQLKSTFVRIIDEPQKQQDNKEENSEVIDDSKKLPWYKRIFN